MSGRLIVSSALVICAAAAAQRPSAPDPWKQHMDLGKKFESHGQYAQAREQLEDALSALRGLPNDSRGFLSRVELGTVAASTGQYIEAEQWDNEAVRIGMELYGKEGAALAVPYNDLAALYRDQGDYPRAEEFCRRALHLVMDQPSTDPALRANILGVLGGILYRRGKLDEAESTLQQSAQIAEKLPPPSGILAADWNNLAEIYARSGQNDKALATYHDAYALCTRIGGSNDPNLFFILAGMASVQARSGNYSEAVSSIQSAIERSGAAGPAATMQVRDALFAEAEWLHKLKRDREAKRVRAQARVIGKTANQNSYAQYTVDARQAAHGIVGQTQ